MQLSGFLDNHEVNEKPCVLQELTDPDPVSISIHPKSESKLSEGGGREGEDK